MATRHSIITDRMRSLEACNIIQDWYAYSPGNGTTKWVFTPRGYGERSLSTSQVEDFILGAMAAINARHLPR